MNSMRTFNSSHIYITCIVQKGSSFGFCVDIGAPRSVIGRTKLNKLLRRLGVKRITRLSSNNSFRFGDVTVCSQGMIEIELKTPSHVAKIPVLMDIVPIDVPALVGFDVLDGEK